MHLFLQYFIVTCCIAIANVREINKEEKFTTLKMFLHWRAEAFS